MSDAHYLLAKLYTVDYTTRGGEITYDKVFSELRFVKFDHAPTDEDLRNYQAQLESTHCPGFPHNDLVEVKACSSDNASIIHDVMNDAFWEET